MHGMAAAQFPEHGKRARGLVRPGALKHQDGAVVSQPSNPRYERHRRRRVQIERVVRAVPRDHGHVDADVRGALDRRAKAPIRFSQVARPVVQVGEVRDPQRAARGHDASRNTAATLST